MSSPTISGNNLTNVVTDQSRQTKQTPKSSHNGKPQMNSDDANSVKYQCRKDASKLMWIAKGYAGTMLTVAPPLRVGMEAMKACGIVKEIPFKEQTEDFIEKAIPVAKQAARSLIPVAQQLSKQEGKMGVAGACMESALYAALHAADGKRSQAARSLIPMAKQLSKQEGKMGVAGACMESALYAVNGKHSQAVKTLAGAKLPDGPLKKIQDGVNVLLAPFPHERKDAGTPYQN